MALAATVFKADLQIADMDRGYYGDHALVLARHPSETEERMMVRLLAYVLNAPADPSDGALEFDKDLWEADAPALCRRDLTGLLLHWIELGQPEEKRLSRACARARRVTVYAYAATAPAWWASVAGRLGRLPNLEVWQFPADQVRELGQLAQRSMNLQVTLQDGGLWIGEGEKSVELTPVRLNEG
jgi:uncharacterized protein YaeQ